MRLIKAKKKDKEYIFVVTFLDEKAIDSRGRYKEKEIASRKLTWREVSILGRQSLFKMAEVIIHSFDFDFDHCFGFFGNTENFYNLNDSENNYELFADLEDEGIEPVDSGSVKKNKVEKVWQKIGDRMIFMFDYGDDRRFWVELKEIKDASGSGEYPLALKRHGRAPSQY